MIELDDFGGPDMDELVLETDIVEGKYDGELERYMTHECKIVRMAATARWKLLKREQIDMDSLRRV